ncbi:hypothetical protein DLNHIDIE_00290 [Acidithiobacillus thiooxidans ATCC 19377]|jgi:hypothetical protein|uniref:Uncharacterized protein n=1 Tax=Acidithiobacillus thiooxidans ATCC 19377 TaxID=637390 RepID=A0A543Q276_ACITH|nr:hypothetical protein DLNHIDIE_00290 [Acidithiobacillus thiooxidans ATCC 19377]
MSKMHLIWSPVNDAWISFFGDSPCSIRGENFFSTIQQARAAIKAAGLRLYSVAPGTYLIASMEGGSNARQP